MSIHYNRSRYNKSISNKEYKCLQLKEIYPLYYDDGYILCPNILKRKYRTWKNTRSKQYKNYDT